VACISTNFPGLTQEVTVDGVTLDSIAVAAPVDGHVPSTFTCFYAGRCSPNVSEDRVRIEHPEELESLFMEDLRQCLGSAWTERDLP
jgi:hypothetical protein